MKDSMSNNAGLDSLKPELPDVIDYQQPSIEEARGKSERLILIGLGLSISFGGGAFFLLYAFYGAGNPENGPDAFMLGIAFNLAGLLLLLHYFILPAWRKLRLPNSNDREKT